MYQSWCDVDFVLVWRAKSTLVKLKQNWKITTILWKQMIAIWRILSIAYRKAKVKLQKEEERDRRTHFLQIQRGSKSQYTKEKHSWEHTILRSQREGTY